MYYIDDIEAFKPLCAQEQSDKPLMLMSARRAPQKILTRESALMHITASSMILSESREHVLMAFHNIYKSWAWTGGHADGDNDMLSVALREAREETGIMSLTPLKTGAASLEIITVPAHIKRSKFVSAHLHLNLSYLFIGDERERVRAKADENAGVRWIRVSELKNYVSEAEMLPIYDKLIKRACFSPKA